MSVEDDRKYKCRSDVLKVRGKRGTVFILRSVLKGWRYLPFME
jgi:hypothetical protein